MTQTNYVVYGKEYHSLEALPPPDRALTEQHVRFLKDRSTDGMPVVLEALTRGNAARSETQAVVRGS